MNTRSSGPPNPRQARYRQLPVRWSTCHLTVALIAICLGVAVISQLGNKTKPVSALYFASPPAQEAVEMLDNRLDEIADTTGEDSPEYQRVLEQLERIESPVNHPLEQIEHGQVWRLVTPMFLHFGPVHLGFNMLWLWTLGGLLETSLRKVKFGLLVLVTAIVSNLGQALIDGPNFGGMSGVIYGLFGFVMVHGKLHPMGGLQLNPRTSRYMLIWLALGFTGMLGPIANWAHTFGLVAGCLVGAGHALLNGGWATIRRRHEFRQAINASSDFLHRCAVCGKTEHQAPDLEFRVSADGHEYCEQHLPANASTPPAG